MPGLTQAQGQRAARKLAKPVSSSAPIKGWNTRDPFEAMDPQYAVLLDNWYPDVNGIVTRKGKRTVVTGLSSSAVKTLANFRNSTSDQLISMCAGTAKKLNVTTGAAVTVGGTFAGTDAWQTVNFNGKQFWANGVELVQIYDGTSFAASGFTGPTMTTLAGCNAIHNRMFFWTGVDCSFWYGGVNSIAGVLSNFPLAATSQTGGNLMAVEVLSYDGGVGLQVYTCFFLNSGEVLIYSGSDPSNANNWAKVGSYMIPMPIAARSIARYGGDIYITTARDHYQLSKLLVALKLGDVPAPSPVTGAMATAYTLGSALTGWQALYYPTGNRMIYNIPNPDGSFSQHVCNMAVTGQPWCRFQNLNAYCWAVFDGSLYFGEANGKVSQADYGSTDDGNAILSQAQQAWNTFGTVTAKRVTAVRPVVQSQGLADFNFALGFDYQPAGITIPDSTITTTNSLIWGAKNWGSPQVWGGSGVTDPRWHIAGGQGAAIGLSLVANSKIQATWVRTDLMIEPGSAL